MHLLIILIESTAFYLLYFLNQAKIHTLSLEIIKIVNKFQTDVGIIRMITEEIYDIVELWTQLQSYLKQNYGREELIFESDRVILYQNFFNFDKNKNNSKLKTIKSKIKVNSLEDGKMANVIKHKSFGKYDLSKKHNSLPIPNNIWNWSNKAYTVATSEVSSPIKSIKNWDLTTI